MERLKKIQPGVAILFFITGCMHIRQGYTMQNIPEILLTIMGSIWIIVSLLISAAHLIDKIKKERAQN